MMRASDFSGLDDEELITEYHDACENGPVEKIDATQEVLAARYIACVEEHDDHDHDWGGETNG